MPAHVRPNRQPAATLLCVALAAWALISAGCQNRPAPPADSVVVTLPHLEHLDVSSCQGRTDDINLLLATRAEAYAKTLGNGSVWYGDGLSMEPIMQPGCWLVTRRQPFDELRPGMVVLYTTSDGRPVAHALFRRTSRGWLAVGVNNRAVDAELVTSTNLAGVIAAVFTPLN